MARSWRSEAPRGGGVLHRIEWDEFFRDKEISPGKVFVLDQSDGSIRSECCINPLDSGVDPTAEVRVIYSEFSDGSTYGERSEATGILATRSLIVKTLRGLDAASDDRTFLRLLAQRLTSADADGFFETLRSFQKSRGTKAARVRVRQDLGNAERHLTAMRAAVTESE